MIGDLIGRVVTVTGAGSGIGAAAPSMAADVTVGAEVERMVARTLEPEAADRLWEVSVRLLEDR